MVKLIIGKLGICFFLLSFQAFGTITVRDFKTDSFPGGGKLVNGCPPEKVEIEKLSPLIFKVYFKRFHAEAGSPYLTKDALCKIQIQFDHPVETILGIANFTLKAAYNLPRNSHARTKISYSYPGSQIRISSRKKMFGPGKVYLEQIFTGKKRGQISFPPNETGLTTVNIILNSILRAAINNQAYLEFNYLKVNLAVEE